MREVKAADMSYAGHSQAQIALELRISQPAVSKILKRVEARMLADVALQAERQRVQHTGKLHHLYRQAIAAWEASKQDSTRRRQRKTDATGGSIGVAELVSENRHGDPRYLETARRLLADIRAIWGVNAPERVAIDASAAYIHLSDVELLAEVARKAEILASTVPVAGTTAVDKVSP